MLENISRLSANDFDEAMDLLDLVFSKAHKPHDFLSLLPKLYQPTDESMRCNFAIRKNGRIRAIVGLFPMTLHAGGKTLKVGGIGGVSTHPRERNSGMMRRLMEACLEEMRAQGCQLSCLSGRRQRYGHYGYEKAGTASSYLITKDNARYFLKDKQEKKIRFEPLCEGDSERLTLASKLYDNQPFCCERPQGQFLTYLKSWDMQPWTAIDSNGNMAGYLVADRTGRQINEIQSDNPDTLLNMVCSWVQQSTEKDASIFIPPWEAAFSRKLGSLCESVSLQQAYNWLVFDWESVIGALLAVKSGLTRLADGEMCLGIKDYGTVRIRVKDGLAVCERTEGGTDLLCDALTATRLVFGPMNPDNVMALPEHLKPLLASWFPLPLCWLPQDGV